MRNVLVTKHALIFKGKIILLLPPYSSQTKNKNKAAFASPRFPSSPILQYSSWESKSRNNIGKFGFFFVKKCARKFLLFSPDLIVDPKLLKQGTFISCVKSQPLQVALINFISKAGWRRALAALWLNNSYYLPSFREAAECQGINIWKSMEICPSTTGGGRGASSGDQPNLHLLWVGFEGPNSN